MRPPLIISLLAPLVLLSSCKDLREDGREFSHLVLHIENTDVKTCLNAGRTRLEWEEGDSIFISNNFDASIAWAIYSPEGSICVDVPAGATEITAIYPSSTSVPVDQRQSEAGVLNGRNYPMSATAPIEGDGATLKFTPCAGAFAMNIFNPRSEGEKLVSVAAVSPQMDGVRCVTLDSPFELDTDASAVKRTYSKQVYLCLDRGKYNKVNFHVVTSLCEYDITTNDVLMDCEGNDFLVLNLDLGNCKASLSESFSSEDFTEDGEIYIGYLEPDNKDPEGPLDLDFSRVGYHYGDTAIPEYPVGRTVTLAQAEDAVKAGTAGGIAEFLQKAIDSTPDRTALLIKEGTYVIKTQLSLQRSIVIRGEGADKTIIEADLPADKSTLAIGPAYKVSSYASSKVTDTHVPVGAFYVNVADASLFNVGDEVNVLRPATDDWIHAIRMDCIDDPVHPSWDPREFDMAFSRKITRKIGTRLYFDLPLPMDIDSIYGGAEVVKITTNRISEAGVEDITVMSAFDPSVTETSMHTRGTQKVTITFCCDENHSKSGLTFRSAEHCWAKGVTVKHYKSWGIGMQEGSRCITVEDCRSVEPVSLITGQRRYAFNMLRCEGCLVENCTADEDRHMFVTANRADGPNVFHNCTGTNCFSNAGPHCYWATMTLYDNVTVDGLLSVEDVGGEADLTSHGWQGANHVLWNCTAPYIICQSPWATARNWAYGSIGTKKWGSYFAEDPAGKDPATWVSTDKWRPDGRWSPALQGGQAGSSRVSPSSLYESQLASRHAAGGRIWNK